MTFYHPDMGSPSDWLQQICHAAQPIRSTTQIWVVTCHQYEISALIPKMSFCGDVFKTSGGVVKCRLFSGTVQNYDNNTISLSLENLLHNHSLLLKQWAQERTPAQEGDRLPLPLRARSFLLPLLPSACCAGQHNQKHLLKHSLFP